MLAFICSGFEKAPLFCRHEREESAGGMLLVGIGMGLVAVALAWAVVVIYRRVCRSELTD
jgi:hypothetical protein